MLQRPNTVIVLFRGYRTYTTCLGAIEESCKEGIDTLFSYDGGLRTYLLKLDYICNDAKDGKNDIIVIPHSKNKTLNEYG